ncbi:MAG: DNA replication and repair protein RecF [Candidatus Delongbacteria bacterium]|nr:DNA replication and repair protein RecF [Candidatus Delongbacteria bacterium]
MIIERLSLINFRNWENQQMRFSPKGNIFLGYNGQGKTNLLEALSYIQNGRSFKNAADKQLIRFNHPAFELTGTIIERIDIADEDSLQKTTDYVIHFDRHQGKSIRVNQQKITRLSRLVGLVNFVCLSLEDRAITQGDPADRRRFLDQAICQIDAEYLIGLQTMKKLIQEKTALLKEHPVHIDLLEIINHQLSQVFSLIMTRRHEFISKLEPFFQEFYQALGDSDETVQLQYRPNLALWDPEPIDQFLHQRLEEEIRYRVPWHGPQRDDLRIWLDHNNSRFYASQGQHKSLIIALKFSLSRYYLINKSKQPILLLDDIFSELDNQRAQSLIALFPHFSQVFITLPRDDELALLPSDFQVFRIQSGHCA